MGARRVQSYLLRRYDWSPRVSVRHLDRLAVPLSETCLCLSDATRSKRGVPKLDNAGKASLELPPPPLELNPGLSFRSNGIRFC